MHTAVSKENRGKWRKINMIYATVLSCKYLACIFCSVPICFESYCIVNLSIIIYLGQLRAPTDN